MIEFSSRFLEKETLKNIRMTALVSVMNKHAVVIAADSAITVTSPYGHKVINSANKVFALSKYHPVGIMFCGNANFMSTPIEVIVKLYRKQLRDRCFATISEYLDDFLGFIKNNHYLFCRNAKCEYGERDRKFLYADL